MELVEVWLLTIDGDKAVEGAVFATEQEVLDYLKFKYDYDLESDDNVAATWDPVRLPLASLKSFSEELK
jgi:hypothetical protein